MPRSLPPLAMILGAAGILPFALLGVASLGGNADSSLTAVRGLAGYGAVILAFLGGVHWGFALEEQSDGRAVRERLGLGVVPSLIGWAAIFSSFAASPVLSLAILIAGFITVVVTEWHAHRKGLVPGGYMIMRWVISVIVVALLTTVLVLRLAGAHVLM